MKYKYTATDQNGKISEGFMDADSGGEVLAYLASRGWRPISIKAADVGAARRLGLFGGRINLTDQIFLAKYISLMLRSGVSLINIVDILATDVDKPSMKRFLKEVRDDLEKGRPLWSTFAKYPGAFSEVFINLVKAGEKSGNLDSVFENLAASLERERGFRGKVTSAFVYPAFIVGVAILIITFLVVFAIPRIAEVFGGSGFKPPTFSRIVFATSAFLSENFIFIGPTALLLIIALIYFARTRAGQGAIRHIGAILPLISGVMKRISLSRFSETLSLLMKSGLPIIEAIKITAGIVTYPGMDSALVRIADEGLARGATLGAAFHREEVFPKVVSNLIAVSEKAGKIDEVLSTLAGFYETEVDLALKRLTSVIEPLLLLIVGGFVGLIALSVILPVYQLVGQF